MLGCAVTTCSGCQVRTVWQLWVLGSVMSDGQRGLACCDSWAHKELDTTEQLN